MDTNLTYELIGYTASVLIAVSMMMSAVVKLRVVNMIGAATFTLYGVLIGSIPVAAMNAFIVVINVYFLIKIFRDREYFHLLEEDEASNYTQRFLEFYKDPIKIYQPAYEFDQKRNFSLFVLRNMVPDGLIQGTVWADGVLTIDLDFVIPRYRDFKIGRYLFRDKQDFFRSKKIRTIRTSAGNASHNNYLEKIGFRKTGNAGTHAYELPLTPMPEG